MSDKDLGRYQIEKELGRGGMSVVHLALDPHLQRQVAIKVMHPHLAVRHDARKRFLQEAKAIARLEHAHVLNVFDYASEEQGVAYIVSEFIDGYTLKEWVNLYGIQYCEVAALLALPIFEALNHAHQHGIIHRDVKPENIMIRKKNAFPVLMDFGIAHMMDAETLTITGAVIGSPAHMAPEVVNGDTLTKSVDIFSMGTVLYWMVCDALPFVAPNPAALFRRILETRFDPIKERKPHVLPELARITEQCMQKEIEARPLNALHIAQQLRTCLQLAGIVDIEKELQALAQDPVAYQATLAARMKLHYKQTAEDLIEKGQYECALNIMLRAQFLDPNDHDVVQCIKKIKALQSKHQLKLWHKITALLAGMMIILCCYNPSFVEAIFFKKTIKNTASHHAFKMHDYGTPLLEPVVTPYLNVNPWHTKLPAPLMNSVAPHAQLLQWKPEIESWSSHEQSSSLNPLQSKVSLVAHGKMKQHKYTQLRKYKNKRHKNKKHKIKTRYKKSKNKHDHHTLSIQKILIGSRYKGANVWLNGKNMGKIYQIERNKGLSIRLRQPQQITFKMRHCEDVTHKIHLKHKPKVIPRISFDCRFKPASFKIITSQQTDIYLRGQQSRRLGVSNQEITYKMKKARHTLSLLLVSPQRKDQAVEINLLAGELTVKRL